MPRILHVASTQIISKDGAAATLPRIDAISKAAALLGAEAVLFPEMCVHGYDFDMTEQALRAVAEPIDGPSAREVRAIAKRNGIVVMAGIAELDGSTMYNTHLIAYPDGRLVTQRKHKLTEGEINAGLTPGPRKRTVFELNGIRCALMICADNGIDALPDDLRRDGIELRFLPCGAGGKRSDMLHASALDTPEARASYAKSRESVCRSGPFDESFDKWGSAFVSCNAVGPMGAETCHRGHCMIVDRHGILRAQCTGTNVLEFMHEQLINAVLEFP